MAHIENLEQHPGGYSHADQNRRVTPAVIRFTQHLAAVCDHDLESCQKLGKWGRQVAGRLGVDADTLDELRDAAHAWAHTLKGFSNTPRVVVQVYTDCSAKRFTCVVWADPGTGELARYTHPDNGDSLTPARAVQLIERAIRSLSVSDAAAPVVEIVLDPEDMLNVPVHTWNGAESDGLIPLLLAVRRRIALRCAPLASIEREEDRRARLERRWNRCVDGKTVYLDEWHVQDWRAYGALEEDHDAARVVVRAGRNDSASMIQLALHLGYPVIMWDHDATEAVADTHFVSLDPEGTLQGLPERVRSYWAKVHRDSSRHPARPALLLDSPHRQLPPVLEMTRQSLSDEASM
ncbi:hypothetical protein [Streptomyces sp. NPDC002088]|uniref:VMAP-C domain-containing protein n=1 Tax=Streptomyces sp. NPDC002088 TaxID=3154665 RepID=UPI003332A004